MITNTRLTELRQVADQCQQHVDKGEATILERDFVDLYTLFKDVQDGVEITSDRSKGPHLSVLFGR